MRGSGFTVLLLGGFSCLLRSVLFLLFRNGGFSHQPIHPIPFPRWLRNDVLLLLFAVIFTLVSPTLTVSFLTHFPNTVGVPMRITTLPVTHL